MTDIRGRDTAVHYIRGYAHEYLIDRPTSKRIFVNAFGDRCGDVIDLLIAERHWGQQQQTKSKKISAGNFALSK